MFVEYPRLSYYGILGRSIKFETLVRWLDLSLVRGCGGLSSPSVTTAMSVLNRVCTVQLDRARGIAQATRRRDRKAGWRGGIRVVWRAISGVDVVVTSCTDSTAAALSTNATGLHSCQMMKESRCCATLAWCLFLIRCWL